MSNYRQHNQRAQELLDHAIAVFEASPSGAIEAIQVEHAEGSTSHILSLHLGSTALRANVVDAVARSKLGLTANKLVNGDSAMLDDNTLLRLRLAATPAQRPQPFYIRSMMPLYADNEHVPGFMQASALVGELPFEVNSAQITPDSIITNDIRGPELEVHSVRLPIGETRRAMATFATIPGVEIDYDSITRRQTNQGPHERWRAMYAPTTQATVVLAHFHELA